MAENPQAKAVRARLEARNKQVEEFYTRQDNLQPTPTQEENDLARVGALDNDEEKEDDGSEWQDEADVRIMTEKIPANNPYLTRDVVADEGGESRPKRGRKARRGRGG